MADEKDQKSKKWTMREIITYIVVGLGALLVLGGVGWLVYSNMYSSGSGGKAVSFKTPPADSITLTAKKI